MSSKKTKENHGDEDEAKIRQRVREFIDGKFVTLVMTLITLWALFGDDIRLAATDKHNDIYFYISFLVSFILFVVELLATSIVVDDYKYSFFFWLDSIAAISLVPDIPYIIGPMTELYGGTLNTANVNISTTGDRDLAAARTAQNMLKSFRLIRLVRIVKLYKYLTKRESEEQEARLREQQKMAQNARQAAMNREMDPTRLGKNLSDVTTRRVIIVVLLMIIVLPILQAQPLDYSPYFGLQFLFWAGRSTCTEVDQFQCDDESMRDWITVEGWYDMLYRYSKSSEEVDGGEANYPLLWLRIPNYMQGGKVQDIKYVPNFYFNQADSYNSDLVLWQEHGDCSGKQVGDECDLRMSEMLLVSYSPDVCQDNNACQDLQSFARFDVKSKSKEQAILNISMTIFVGIILTIASITFQIDTQKIVILPITKMVLIIKGLADNPLKLPERQQMEEEFEAKGNEEATQMLENTIYKIGVLLQISFGEDGSQILSKNMSGEGELSLMRPGNKVTLVIGHIQIEQFHQITETLEAEISIFLNKVCNIIHECCRHWSGFPSRIGNGIVLIIWRLPEITDKDRDEDDLSNPVMQQTDIANRALVAFAKIIAELSRAYDLQSYKHHLKMIGKFGNDFKTKIAMTLHIGWSVEGVVGSEYKIDPTYLSPNIQLGQDLLEYTRLYEVPILLTEQYYGYLTVKAKSCCRRIDTVQLTTPPNNNQFGLFTYDFQHQELPAPENHQLGRLIKVKQFDSVNVESFQHKGVDYMFTLDNDLVQLQKSIPQTLRKEFITAYVHYMSGQWQDALASLDQALTTYQNDGPSKCMKKYIQTHGGNPPSNWERCRVLSPDDYYFS